MTATPEDPSALLEKAGPVTLPCGRWPRLSTAVLARAARRVDPVLLQEPSAELRWALLLLGLAPRFGVEGLALVPPRSVPFQLALGDDGAITVAVDRGIASAKVLPDAAMHSWVRPLLPPQLVVEFAAVENVNSVLVAWLLQLCQAAKPAPMTVSHTRSVIATQFRQLRLDQMMTIA